MYFSESRKRGLIDSSSSAFSSATSQHSSFLHMVELGLKVAWGSVLPAVDHSTFDFLDAVALHTFPVQAVVVLLGQVLAAEERAALTLQRVAVQTGMVACREDRAEPVLWDVL